MLVILHRYECRWPLLTVVFDTALSDAIQTLQLVYSELSIALFSYHCVTLSANHAGPSEGLVTCVRHAMIRTIHRSL